VTFSPTTTSVKASSFGRDDDSDAGGSSDEGGEVGGGRYEVYEQTTTSSSKSTSFSTNDGGVGVFKAAVVDGLLSPVATSRRPASPGPLSSKRSPEDILSEYVSCLEPDTHR
jgi:hypothetical protein